MLWVISLIWNMHPLMLYKVSDPFTHLDVLKKNLSSYEATDYRRVIKGDRPADRLGPLKEWETDNLRIIRAFEDHDGSESQFCFRSLQ